MLLNPYRFGGGGGGPGDHRYWRVKNFVGTTDFGLVIHELRLYGSSTLRTSLIVPTVSTPPSFNTAAALTNELYGSGSDEIQWATAIADTLVITFDFTSAVGVDSITMFRSNTANRFPTSVQLDYSDNNSSWTAAGTAPIVAPGGLTFSAPAFFV